MIKANELRVGNWVEHLGKTLEVTPYWLYYFLNQNKCGDSIEHLEPIPLTAEILEKAGFKDEGIGHWRYVHPLFKISSDLETISFHREILKDVKFKHLHQLQNLCFALTGEELKIEL